MTTSQSTIVAGAADRQARRGEHKRHDIEIDIRRKPPVEAELGPARRLAPLEGREVEIGEADRLLELVDLVAGEKDPRHVGFAADHLADWVGVGGGLAEERDLLGKRRPAGFIVTSWCTTLPC